MSGPATETHKAPHLTGAQLDGADFTGAWPEHAVWPSEAAVPEGWERDADGRLKQPNTSGDGQGTSN
jgi:hypothetical protein